MLSLREAAEETGLTKPALLKAIKKGRISAQKNDRGEWEIDPAELFRVYERKEPVSDESETVNGDHANRFTMVISRLSPFLKVKFEVSKPTRRTCGLA